MTAREFYSAFSAPEVSTVSLTEWASVGSLTFTPQTGVAYVVFWSFEAAKTNVTNTSLQFRVAVDGVAVDQASVRGRSISDYPQFFGFIGLPGDGIAKTVTLDIINLQAPYAVVGRNAAIVAVALGANDLYVESLPRTETNSSTLATLCEINTAATAGEYLVLGMSFTDNNNTTAPTYAGLHVNGAASTAYTVGHGTLADVRPLVGMWPRTLTADGDLIARWMGRSHTNGGVCGWRSNRVLALRLEDFDAAYTAVAAANSDGLETDWTSALDITPTVAAAPHLVLAAYQVGSNGTSTVLQTRLAEAEVELGASTLRPYAVNIDRATHQGLVRVREIEVPGEKAWQLERKGDGAASTRIGIGAALAVLDLGSAGQTVAAMPRAFVANGDPPTISAGRRLAGDRRGLNWAGLGVVMGRGFRIPLGLGLLPLGGQLTGLKRGLRVAATFRNHGVSGSAVNLTKTVAGARLSAGRGVFLANTGASVPRAGRLLRGEREIFGWSRLEGRLAADMRIASDCAAFALEPSGSVEWGWTHILKPNALTFAFQGHSGTIRYSGQQFWQPIATAPAAWSPQPLIQESWSPRPATPETWN